MAPRESVHARELLRGIVALARGLNMAVLAEGAERDEEVAMLKDMGCDYVQGFAYARPQSPTDAMAFAHMHERDILDTIPRPQPFSQIRETTRRRPDLGLRRASARPIRMRQSNARPLDPAHGLLYIHLVI